MGLKDEIAANKVKAAKYTLRQRILEVSTRDEYLRLSDHKLSGFDPEVMQQAAQILAREEGLVLDENATIGGWK